MSESTEDLIRTIVYVCNSIAITMALAALFNTFMWAWLAAIMAFIVSIAVQLNPRVAKIEAHMADAAVLGARKLSGWLRRVAA